MTYATPAQLEGRTARCSYDSDREGNTHPDSRRPSIDLLGDSFFQYHGEGSRHATDICAVCRYSIVAHDPSLDRHAAWISKVGEHDFVPAGPKDFDEYYCGCRGWD
jgi:hypothetical protein